MKKVFLCTQTSFNGCDEFVHVVKVVEKEQDALDWICEVEDTENSWRRYEGRILE